MTTESHRVLICRLFVSLVELAILQFEIDALFFPACGMRGCNALCRLPQCSECLSFSILEQRFVFFFGGGGVSSKAGN